jgi:lipopolysaccharide transport system permease protein
MVVFSLFFGKLAEMPSDGVPYPIFSYTGLLPWNYFAQSVTQSSNSLVLSSHLITKVYFPRLIIPVSTVLAPLVDFLIAFTVLIIMMLFYNVPLTARVLSLPFFLLLAVITASGVGLWLSALNVQYRDIRYVVPFLIQFLFFATPVVYPSSLLDEPWRTLYGLNPMVGVVEGFRWALLDTAPPQSMVFLSIIVAILLLISGAYYFQRVEKTFADLV